jgi:hypothetical protein
MSSSEQCQHIPVAHRGVCRCGVRSGTCRSWRLEPRSGVAVRDDARDGRAARDPLRSYAVPTPRHRAFARAPHGPASRLRQSWVGRSPAADRALVFARRDMSGRRSGRQERVPVDVASEAHDVRRQRIDHAAEARYGRRVALQEQESRRANGGESTPNGGTPGGADLISGSIVRTIHKSRGVRDDEPIVGGNRRPQSERSQRNGTR